MRADEAADSRRGRARRWPAAPSVLARWNTVDRGL